MACDKAFPRQPKAVQARVLIAEDEAMIALSLSDLLEAEGYDVTIASDGAEALAEVQRLGVSFSVLVTDLNMPYMSGENLIHAIRADRPKLPVIVVTGSAPPEGLEGLRGSGGNREPFALLHKPIDYADLIDTLRRAIVHNSP